MVCELDKASFAWYRDPNVPNFAAARRATVLFDQLVFHYNLDFTYLSAFTKSNLVPVVG